MFVSEGSPLGSAQSVVNILKGISTIAAVLMTGLWAWSRFVLERGLLPPSEMTVTVRKLGSTGSGVIVQAEIRIRNRGSSALIVNNLRIRLRHIERGDSITVIRDQSKSAFGHLEFAHASVQGIPCVPKRTQLEQMPEAVAPHSTGKKRKPREPREYNLGTGEFLVVPYNTFVLPDVTQMYAFVTCLPEATDYVLAKASFNYEMRPNWVQLRLHRVSRGLGMVQFSLNHVKEPHTVESAFRISDHDSQARGNSPFPLEL